MTDTNLEQSIFLKRYKHLYNGTILSINNTTNMICFYLDLEIFLNFLYNS